MFCRALNKGSTTHIGYGNPSEVRRKALSKMLVLLPIMLMHKLKTLLYVYTELAYDKAPEGVLSKLTASFEVCSEVS